MNSLCDAGSVSEDNNLLGDKSNAVPNGVAHKNAKKLKTSSSSASNYFAQELNDDDFEECKIVERFRSKPEKKTPVDDRFLCMVCQSDITHLNLQERSVHVNGCIDGQSSEGSSAFILECPLCFKHFATPELRSSHIKKCGRSRGLSIQSVINAIHLQEKHVLERRAMGLPLNNKPKSVKPKKPAVKNFLEQPKSSMQCDIHLAKALSLSLKEEEAQKQMDLLPFIEDSTPATLQPPLVYQNPGHPVSKKKKMYHTPMLLTRSEEERNKLLLEKFNAIIDPANRQKINTEFPEGSHNSDVEKPTLLWNLCSKAEDKTLYYVDQLIDWIMPSEVEVGSKLCSLSQIPGHQIFTQLPLDYTFSSTEENNEYAASSQSNKPTSIISGLQSLIGNSWMSDVDIHTASGIVIPAHKLILALRCPTLKSNFEACELNPRTVLDWKGVSFEAALHFLNFIYTGSSEWKEDIIGELFQLAKKYGVLDLLNILKSDSETLEIIASGNPDELNTSANMDLDQSIEDSIGSSMPLQDAKETASTSPIDECESNMKSGNVSVDIHMEENSKNSLDFHEGTSCSYIKDDRYSPHISRTDAADMDGSLSDAGESDSQSSDRIMCTVISKKDSIDHIVCNKSSVLERSGNKESSVMSGTHDPHSNSSEDSCKILSSTFVSNPPSPAQCSSNDSFVIGNKPITLTGNSSEGVTFLEEIRTDQSDFTEQQCYTFENALQNSIGVSKQTPSPDLSDEMNATLPLSQKGMNYVGHSDDIRTSPELFNSQEREPLQTFQKLHVQSINDADGNITDSDGNINDSDGNINDDIIHISDSPKPIMFAGDQAVPQKNEFGLKCAYNNGGTSSPEILGYDSDFEIESYDEITATSQNIGRGLVLKDRDLKKSTPMLSCSETNATETKKNGADDIIHIVSDDEDIRKTSMTVSDKMNSDDDIEEMLPLSERLKRLDSQKSLTTTPLESSYENPSTSRKEDSFQDFMTPKNTTKQPESRPTLAASDLKEKKVCEEKKKQNKMLVNGTKNTFKNTAVVTPNGIKPLFKFSDSPITPFPDYKQMQTPEIKEALRKIGVKALPRKKAMAVLSHVYDETHPFYDNASGSSQSTSASTLQPATQDLSSTQQSKKRKHLKDSPDKVPHKKPPNTVLNKDVPQENGMSTPTDSNNSKESDELNFSFSSDLSDSSQPTNKNNAGLIQNFIMSKEELYKQVLSYVPLNLKDFQQELKENGIKIGIQNLMDYLDEQCITFTCPRKEEYKKKQQARTQRFRKRVIAKLSQQQSSANPV